MKSEHKKVLVLFIILLLIPIGRQLFKYFVNRETSLSQIQLYISKSEKHNWQAVFISHGSFIAHTITLTVVPDPKTRGTEVVIGDVQYEDLNPFVYTFRWSADQTVIAVLNNTSIKGTEKDPYTGLCYTYAYDFLTNEVIRPPLKNTQVYDPNTWNENAKQITSLLEERGGAGKIINFQQMRFKHTSRKERVYWQMVLKKARKNRYS